MITLTQIRPREKGERAEVYIIRITDGLTPEEIRFLRNRWRVDPGNRKYVSFLDRLL